MLKKLGMKAMLVLLGLGLFAGVNAQTATIGNLSGTVRDPSGAIVPKADVEIKEEGTGATRTAHANDDGYYVFTSLPAGTYTVSTAPPGFKRTVATGVEVHVGENKVLNLDVQVGQVSETVTITSDAAPVETRSGDVSRNEGVSIERHVVLIETGESDPRSDATAVFGRCQIVGSK